MEPVDKAAKDPPVILAVDCSGPACSLALGNGQSLVEEFTDEAGRHAGKLLPMYRRTLERSAFGLADIETIAVASGPGSFTGLRIAFSFAQGLAFALSVPLIRVSSLEALAHSGLGLAAGKNAGQIQVCLDARMGELYVAGFTVGADGRALHRQYEDALIAVDDFDLSSDYRSTALLGSGFGLDALSHLESRVTLSNACIRASSVHQIGLNLLSEGKAINALGAEPAYLRRETAWKNVEQQRQARLSKAGAGSDG